MEVQDEHVVFRTGEHVRKVKVTGDRTLRQAAESLCVYSEAIQDLTLSFVANNRCVSQKLAAFHLYIYICTCSVYARTYLHTYSAKTGNSRFAGPRSALKDMCKDANLKVSGSTPEIKSRLIEHRIVQIDEDGLFCNS